MKKISKILISLAGAFVALPAIGQIEGKTYNLGDTIFVDGQMATVFQVDETGMHGSASMVISLGELDAKASKQQNKFLEKQLKSGKLSQAEYDLAIAAMDARPLWTKGIPKEKDGKGTVYRIDKWAESAPKGWRICNMEDFRTMENILNDGKGEGGEINRMGHLKDMKNHGNSDHSIYAYLSGITALGIVVCDTTEPADVRFVHGNGNLKKVKLTVENATTHNEIEYAVTDF